MLELLFVGALVGTVHLAAPCGQLQAGLLGAKRDGAGKVARVRAAAHGKGLSMLARKLVIGINKRLHGRIIGRDREWHLRMAHATRHAKAPHERLELLADGIGARTVGKTHVDDLLDMAIRHTDDAGVAGERTKRRARRVDTQAAAIGVRMHKGQKLDELVLGRRQQALVACTKRVLGLAQIRHDQADGVNRSLGHRGMTANAVGKNLRMPVIERRDLQAVGVLDRRRQLISGNRELADGLRRNGVARLGTAPRHNAPAVDLGAHKRRPKLALLGIADRELGIGRKQKVGACVVLQIMVNVGHAHFLIAAQQRAEGVARGNAVLEQIGAGVERQHRRTLVVDNAAAEQPALATLHRKRVGVPARAGGHHVHVADGRELLVTAARDIGNAHIALVVARLIAELLRNAERAVERVTDRAAKRRARLCIGRNCHGRIAHQLLDIGDDVLPDLVDILGNALLHLIHGRPPYQ